MGEKLVVLMDRLKVHRSDRVKEACEELGILRICQLFLSRLRFFDRVVLVSRPGALRIHQVVFRAPDIVRDLHKPIEQLVVVLLQNFDGMSLLTREAL